MTKEELKEQDIRLNKLCFEYQEKDKRIAELEKENAELEYQLTHRNCVDCSNHSSNLRMRNLALEKENAELKENYRKRGDTIISLERQLRLNIHSDNLTKAKEIIKRFSEFVNNDIEYDPEHPQEHTDLWNELCKEAEQFINSEVEK